MTRVLPWAWLVCWAGAFVLTHVPIAPRESTRLPHLDKALHAAMYFVICYLGGLSLAARGRVNLSTLLTWALVYAVYGVVDEWTQPWFGRGADFMDWVANVVGIGLATAMLSARRARASNSESPPDARTSRFQ